ncbi:MAG: hypothetical protein ACI9XZ_000294 [Alphaproteobacteria bacterium]|jgi:hypothetical protein
MGANRLGLASIRRHYIPSATRSVFAFRELLVGLSNKLGLLADLVETNQTLRPLRAL